MRELALQRGLTVRESLIAKGLPGDRLFVGDPKLRSGGSSDNDKTWTPRSSSPWTPIDIEPDTTSRAFPEFVEALPHGIFAIDTGFHRPRFDAAYLLVEGRSRGLRRHRNQPCRATAARRARRRRLTPDDVDWLIVTHVHLDHAGGAGLLMQSLPARAARGTTRRGIRSTRRRCPRARARCNGDAEMERSYGELVPVPRERVVVTHDDMTLGLYGRPLRFIDTPATRTTTPSGTSVAAASSPATPSACRTARVRRRRPALDAADDDAGGLRARAVEGVGAAHARFARSACT